jgi:hypothetical protein
MRGLLADMGGAQWRVREAASLAMADLLQGRRWAELQPTFEELWGMTLRWLPGGRAGGSKVASNSTVASDACGCMRMCLRWVSLLRLFLPPGLVVLGCRVMDDIKESVRQAGIALARWAL